MSETTSVQKLIEILEEPDISINGMTDKLNRAITVLQTDETYVKYYRSEQYMLDVSDSINNLCTLKSESLFSVYRLILMYLHKPTMNSVFSETECLMLNMYLKVLLNGLEQVKTETPNNYFINTNTVIKLDRKLLS